MKWNWIGISLLAAGTALPTRAELQFTKVPSNVSDDLHAVAYDGSATFVAVGSNSVAARAVLVSDQLPWTSNVVATNKPLTFQAATWGQTTRWPQGMFLVSGSNNLVFSSPNGLNWLQLSNALGTNNSAPIAGLAYNPRNLRFAAAPQFVSLAWSDDPANPAPTNSGSPWNPGQLKDAAGNDNAAPIESFRAVIPLDADGYAVCGIRGDVRISADAGSTWQGGFKFPNLTGPDLLGIAWDGGTTLVCVGKEYNRDIGAILISKDKGITWTNVVPILPENSPRSLNAVAYAGRDPGFIAVGNGGVILTSTNGSIWTPRASPPGTPNLLSVVFAHEGSLQGIAVLVGEAGTIVLGGTIPAAPTNPIGATNYAGYANNPLQVTVPSYITVDWFDRPTGGTQLATNTATFMPEEQTNNVATNFIYYAQARDRRTQFTNQVRTPVPLTLVRRPTSIITSQTNETCNVGSKFTVTADLTGATNWTVTWWDGVVSNVTASPATRDVFPTNTFSNLPTNYLYAVKKLTDGNIHLVGENSYTNLTGDVTGVYTVTVFPRPTATVQPTGGARRCEGGSAEVSAVLTGFGPWTVTWALKGVAVATNRVLTGTTDTLLVTPPSLDPNGTTVHKYTVTALSDDHSHCFADPSLDLIGEAEVTVLPRPKAVVSGEATICNGDSTVVQAQLTGIGPWTVSWSSNGVPVMTQANVTTPMATLTVTPVNPNRNDLSTHVYTVSFLSDANCVAQPGDLSGGATITVTPRPTATVSGDSTICNGAPAEVQAALTGMGPWTVTWSSNGVPVAVQTNVTSPVTTLSVSPTNPNPDVAITHTYTVSALRTDACVARPDDLFGRAVVTVAPRPTATVTLLGEATLCAGESTEMQATLTGIPPWTVTWSSNGVPVTVQSGVISRTTALTVTPSPADPNHAAMHIYTVSALTDDICEAQTNDLVGRAVIVVAPRPTATVSGDAILCSGGSSEVHAVLTGIPPWTVTWSSNGVAVATNLVLVGPTNTFTVTPASLSPNAVTIHTFTVSALSDDVCIAKAGDITGRAVVTVAPRPTAVVSGTKELCSGESAVVEAALTGIPPWTVTWSSNGVAVATHTVETGNTDRFTVQPSSLSPGAGTIHTYTVSALEDDFCTAKASDVSGSAVVTVFPRPTARVTGDATLCSGESTVVQAALTGIGPWEVTWSSNGVAVATHTNVTLSTDTLTVGPLVAGPNTAATNIYTVSALSDDFCAALPGNLIGTAVVKLDPVPPIANCRNITVALDPDGKVEITPDDVDAGSTDDCGIAGKLVEPQSFSYQNLGVNNVILTVTDSAGNEAECLAQVTVGVGLTIERNGDQVVLSWFGDFTLQSTTVLASPPSGTVWSDIQAGMAGTKNTWPTSVLPGPTFYRLYKP